MRNRIFLIRKIRQTDKFYLLACRNSSSHEHEALVSSSILVYIQSARVLGISCRATLSLVQDKMENGLWHSGNDKLTKTTGANTTSGRMPRRGNKKWQIERVCIVVQLIELLQTYLTKFHICCRGPTYSVFHALIFFRNQVWDSVSHVLIKNSPLFYRELAHRTL